VEEAARPATAEDVPRLGELVAEAVAEQAEGRGGRIWAARETRALPAEASLAALVADPGALVLAGTIDATVVGYAVTVTEQLRTGDVLGVVTDVYVDPGARGVGVGEALLDQVVAWCEAAGCIGIDALALPGNRSTKNFFESFGFTARAIVVHRRLR
jgi:GNAT superfamily N-acetyltransferase